MWIIKVSCCRDCFGPMGYKYLTRSFLTELEAEQFATTFVDINGNLRHKKWKVSLEFDTLADRPVSLPADGVYARSPAQDRTFTRKPRVTYSKMPRTPKPVVTFDCDDEDDGDCECNEHCDCPKDCPYC